MQEKDYEPIEQMRHRDTDGDGVSDFIDSNGYSKPSDRYRYISISDDDFRKLRANGFNVADNCRKSSTGAGFILRYSESQAPEVNRILKSVPHSVVLK